jgi:ribonuclease HI
VAERKKQKFYVVWEGRRPGIYTNWPDAQEQVTAYRGAKFKSFDSRGEAEAAFRGAYEQHVGKPAGWRPVEDLGALGVRLDGVAVDAACAGVPGPMEYQGVVIRTGEQMFHAGPYHDGTNNVGEFLAIVQALMMLKDEGKPDVPVYSDSKTARSWVEQKTYRTNLARTPRNGPIFDLLDWGVEWLKKNRVTNPILVWETERWGEIPADFGRK